MKKINCLQMFFGYDDYDCEYVYENYPTANGTLRFLIPAHSEEYHNIKHPEAEYKTATKLPYFYDSLHSILNFTYKGNLTPGMNLYTEAVSNFISPVILKGLFKDCEGKKDAAIIKDSYYREPADHVSLYISHSFKKILVFSSPLYDFSKLPNGCSLSRILEHGYTEENIVLDKDYLRHFTRMCMDNVLSVDSGLFDILKHDGTNICTMSQLLRACERPEDDLDIEKLKNIELMLTSKDEATSNLGIAAISALNFWKYRNTIACMINHHALVLWDSSLRANVAVRNFGTTYKNFTLNYKYTEYIRKEDWELLKQYLKSIGESDSNLYELYRVFHFDFINRCSIKLSINYEI